MRIGMIAHNKYALGEPMHGGLEAFTYDLMRGLRERGHELIVFGVTGSPDGMGVLPCLSPSSMIGKDYCENDFRVLAHQEYLRMMLSIDQYELNVIFNNSLHYVPPTMATSVRTPMLTVLHTPPIPELAEAYAYPNVGGYLCSPSQANALSWRGLIADCEIVPNAVDLNLWKPNVSKSVNAIWSGRIVPEKGLHLAIDAAYLANIELRIAGPVSDIAYFERFIRPRLGPRVTYMGHLSRPALALEVANAAVALVTPRWEEPFGLVVAEALACGTPVAGFRRGALPELITPDLGVLVEPDDVAGLAEAIRSAGKLSSSRCRFTAEGRWAFEDHVTRYEMALEKVAHELAADPHARWRISR